MGKKLRETGSEIALEEFLRGKSESSIALFHSLVAEFKKIGSVTVHPAKTMIGIATTRKRIVYVIQFGKDFIHAVFPFDQSYQDNLCFMKIVQVPGTTQYNHHFRMYGKEDINKEVKQFMRLAFELGS
jgi:hypothetical protein